jgi:hypothetical protein
MKSRNRLWQALTLLMLLSVCGCDLTDREKAAADTAAIGFFAGGAVGCTAAGIIHNRSSTAFAIGCPAGMVLGAVIGGAIGYASYTPPPPASAIPGPVPPSSAAPSGVLPPGPPPGSAAPMGGPAPGGPPGH